MGLEWVDIIVDLDVLGQVTIPVLYISMTIFLGCSNIYLLIKFSKLLGEFVSV